MIKQFHFLLFIYLICSIGLFAQTVSDIDENTYETVVIGNQTWMKENLRTTRLNDGTLIPNVSASEDWITLSAMAYCWSVNKIIYKDPYGGLYNWYSVESNKLCPSGWKVPSKGDWILLTEFLGGDSIAGKKLKATGIEHWEAPNENADNSSGFTGLGAGWRDSEDDGNFHSPEYFAFDARFWSTDASGTEDAWSIGLNLTASVSPGNQNKRDGLGIRCIQDPTISQMPFPSTSQVLIYPNPASDIIYLKGSRDAEVTIYDMLGHVKFTHTNVGNISLSELKKGVYLIEIKEAGETIIRKLMKY